MCLFHIDRLLCKKSVTVFISIKTIYESALFFKRLSFKNITHVFLTNVKGETCDFIVMSLCFSNSSKVECDVYQPLGFVNCCMRVLQRHRLYNYLGDYGGLEGPKCGLWGRVGQQAGTGDAAVQVQRL